MTVSQILLNLWTGIKEIFGSMFHDPSIWWFLAPIIVFWLILEIYFSEYKKEELGWNTALGNGLSVFWMLIVSTKYIFEDHLKNFAWSKFFILIIFMLYASFIIYNSFSHKLSAHVSFLLASPTLTYYLSGVAILWTYGNLNVNIYVLVDLILLYGVILLFELVLKKLIKGKDSSDFSGGFGKSSESPNTESNNLGDFKL